MTEELARAMFHQLVSVVQYSHQRGIVPRDLKSDNILRDSDMTIRLADFSGEFADKKLSSFWGTICYSAPEVFQHQTYDGPKVDVWRLRVVFLQDGDGVVPFVKDTLGN